MMDNLKFINLELESISYKEEVDNNPDLKAKLEKERLDDKNNKQKLEFLNIPDPRSLEKIDLTNKLLKNVQLTNIQCDNNTDYFKSLEIMSLDDKINAYTNVRDKVFKNRNMPTMSLDEFADKQIAQMEEDKIKQKEWEAENKIEEEDEDREINVNNKTRADREWDDWKDLNEKGSGNKMHR